MSVRTILLYLTFAVLLLVLLVVLAWPFLPVESYLAKSIVREIESRYDGSVELNQVTLGLSSLNVYGLKLQNSDTTQILDIPEINLRFGFLRLISSGFNPLGSLSTVKVTAPAMYLQLAKETSSESTKTPTGRISWDLLDALPPDFSINRLELESGIFQLTTSGRTPIWSVQNINGDIKSDASRIFRGRFQIGERNREATTAEFRFRLDANTRSFESALTANLNNIRLGSEIGLPDSLGIGIDDLMANIRLWSSASESGLEGAVEASGLSLYDESQTLLDCDTLELEVGGWELAIKPTHASGLTGEWFVKGGIPDLRNPNWDVSISASSRDCSELQSHIPEGVRLTPSGEATLSIDITGRLTEPSVKVDASLENLELYGMLTEHLLLAAEWEGSTISVDSLKFVHPYGRGALDGSLQLHTENGNYSGDVAWQGIMPSLEGPILSSLEAEFSVVDGVYTLDGFWHIPGDQSDSLILSVDYSKHEDELVLDLEAPGHPGYVGVRIEAVSNEPLYTLNFQEPIGLLKRLSPWSEWEKLSGFYISGELRGTPKNLDSQIEVRYARSRSRFAIDGTITANSLQDINYSGSLRFQQASSTEISGTLDLRWLNNQLNLVELELDDAIYGSGSIDFKTKQFGLTELIITNWDINRGIQLLKPEWSGRVGGILDARYEMYGSLEKPSARLNGYASRGYYTDKSDFWAVISAELEQDHILINECNIGRGILSLIRVYGSSQLNGTELDLKVESKGIDVSEFCDLFGGNSNLLAGPVTFDASLSGTVQQPGIKARCEILNGRIYKVPYQRMSFMVQSAPENLKSINISRFELIQADDLSATGTGEFKMAPALLSFEFLLDGNVLKLPELIDRAILESHGQGEISASIVVDEDGLHADRAHLVVRDGYMRFPDVVKEIENIRADLSMENHRVEVNQFRGTVDRQNFYFNNYFSDQSDSSAFQHIYFAGVDIDLGIITFRTEGRGLFSRIPALMPKGSMGYLKFGGDHDSDSFIFAGPTKNLSISGIIQTSKSILTYPFPPTRQQPSKFVRGVLEILESANWDIQIIPERDNRYVKEIQTELGSPFLEGMSGLLTTIDVDLTVNPSLSHLNILGNMERNDFRLMGSLVSTRGSIEYLDLKFNVDEFKADFDEHDPLPWVEGRGQTVYIDTLGITRTIYLTMYLVDPTTGERHRRGRWGDFVFILEDDTGSSQEQILAAMGYSPEQITEKMTDLSGQIISDAVLRRLIRPLERELESVFKVDYIRLQPAIAKHLFDAQIRTLLGYDPDQIGQVGWGAYYLNESQLTIGKYFSDDIFVSYTGLYESALNATNERQYGFVHRWVVEYRVLPLSNKLTLNFEYEYDSLEQLRDRAVLLRYSIVF